MDVELPVSQRAFEAACQALSEALLPIGASWASLVRRREAEIRQGEQLALRQAKDAIGQLEVALGHLCDDYPQRRRRLQDEAAAEWAELSAQWVPCSPPVGPAGHPDLTRGPLPGLGIILERLAISLGVARRLDAQG